jgi:hypothetical protein
MMIVFYEVSGLNTENLEINQISEKRCGLNSLKWYYQPE